MGMYAATTLKATSILDQYLASNITNNAKLKALEQ